MKNQPVKFILPLIALLAFPQVNFAQKPALHSAANYILFTSTGAVGNTGVSQIMGSIGTNNGAITGFELPTIIAGNVDSGNAAALLCSTDLQDAYDQLFNTAPTSSSHTPAFGTGETLFAGVYAIGGAGSVAGDLTLDAQGDPNAIFIFKFGGAFTTGASTTIHLSNGALSCNVFWGAEGAIAMAASTTMKGTLIANNGAISMGADGSLEGRLFSTTGAASVYGVTAVMPPCVLLPVEFMSFTGTCNGPNVSLQWVTEREINNNYYTVQRSAENIHWQNIGTVVGSVNSNPQHNYRFTDSAANKGTAFYRIKQTDLSGNYKYGNTIAVKQCQDNAADNFSIYPNPSYGQFRLLFSGNTDLVHSIEIFNPRGQKIYSVSGFRPEFNLGNTEPGVYFMHVQLNARKTILKIVVRK